MTREPTNEERVRWLRMTRLQLRIEELEDVLAEAREYFKERADADQEPGDDYPRPNEAMRLLTVINEALGDSDA